VSRQRMIYPETFTSEDFNSLSLGARLLFIGCIATADDYGRGRGGIRTLKATVFPADDLTIDEVGSWADEVSGRGMVVFYDAEGSRYYQIAKWDTYQKPKYKSASQIPPLQRDSRARSKPGPDRGQVRATSGPDPETRGEKRGGEEREILPSENRRQDQNRKPAAHKPRRPATPRTNRRGAPSPPRSVGYQKPSRAANAWEHAMAVRGHHDPDSQTIDAQERVAVAAIGGWEHLRSLEHTAEVAKALAAFLSAYDGPPEEDPTEFGWPPGLEPQETAAATKPHGRAGGGEA
jgi:hypothetical protein